MGRESGGKKAGGPSASADGLIWLAATPIGNSEDASPRLTKALASADVIAAEDTRRLRRLCAKLNVEPSGRIVSLYEHNEQARAEKLIEQAAAGAQILVVTDAGTPTVSDPGFRLVQAASATGIRVSPLPGPSAALAALCVSGLPTDRFAFEGFLPRPIGEARKKLREAAQMPHTLIYFESPRRTVQTLELMASELGEGRPAALCRELTKPYEEVIHGTLGELAEQAKLQEILGEITIVVGGCPPVHVDAADLAQAVRDLAARERLRLKDAAAQIARETGARKHELYQAALELESTKE